MRNINIIIMVNKLSEDKINEMITMYISGAPIKEISEKVGAVKSCIFKYLREYGINVNRRGNCIKNITFDPSLSIGENAMRNNYASNHAYLLILNRRGIKVKENMDNVKKTKAISLFNMGHTINDIAKVMHIDRHTISKLLKECEINTERNRYGGMINRSKYKEDVMKLLLDGHSVVDISRILRCNRKTVSRIKKNIILPERSTLRGKIRALGKDKLFSKTGSEICKELNIEFSEAAASAIYKIRGEFVKKEKEQL